MSAKRHWQASVQYLFCFRTTGRLRSSVPGEEHNQVRGYFLLYIYLRNRSSIVAVYLALRNARRGTLCAYVGLLYICAHTRHRVRRAHTLLCASVLQYYAYSTHTAQPLGPLGTYMLMNGTRLDCKPRMRGF